LLNPDPDPVPDPDPSWNRTFEDNFLLKFLSQIKSKIPLLFINIFFQKVVSAILYLYSGKKKLKNN
jgi:hypothetical protein